MPEEKGKIIITRISDDTTNAEITGAWSPKAITTAMAATLKEIIIDSAEAAGFPPELALNLALTETKVIFETNCTKTKDRS